MRSEAGTSGIVTTSARSGRGRGPPRPGRCRRRPPRCRRAGGRGPRPVVETSATSASRTRRSQNGVTSASVPSANRATTASRPVAPGRSSRDSAGRISIALGRGPRRVAPGAVGDPGADDPVLPRPGGEPPAPLVRHLAGGLQQDQAAVRVEDVHAAAQRPRARSPGSPGRGRGRRGSGSARPAPGTTRGSSRRCSRAARTGWRRGGRSRRPAAPTRPAAAPARPRRPTTAGPPASPGARPLPRRRVLIGPLPWVHFGSSTKVTSSVFPSGSESFRLAASKPSAETVTFTSLVGQELGCAVTAVVLLVLDDVLLLPAAHDVDVLAGYPGRARCTRRSP